MLYLEDYLEMIEHLPQEFKDRFTEMREMDLQVQNTIEKAREDAKKLFVNAPKLKKDDRDAVFQNIMNNYTKALEDADEKVMLADQIHDLVTKYIMKLSQDLTKFKMELEADNGGITEILEKRSLELDNPSSSQNHIRNRKRKYSSIGADKSLEPAPKQFASALEPPRNSSTSSTSSTSSSSSEKVLSLQQVVQQQQQPIAYGLSQGNNAIAVAASQAIAATQQMQQGRRTASLKASYEAINSGFSREFTLATENKTSKQKKIIQSPSLNIDYEDSCDSYNTDGQADKKDAQEPVYCICKEVSYGDMVACDNKNCQYEWFHYNCVGITQPPKGKWYCPECSAETKPHKKRGRKEKS